MVNINKLKEIVDSVNKEVKKTKPNYNEHRRRLCKLVDKYGYEAVSVATGLSDSTVRQHYRNVTGSSMISQDRLNKADEIFKLYKEGDK